ncbi:hypothetical protein DFH28DRAFT_1123244 [Melampsora americana]|nr:hypothetical protein DFH28DRAFT_1123244 [Melampsora americana]
MEDTDDCNCLETTIISTITTNHHSGKTQSVKATQTITSSQANVVTVVVQLGVFPSGINLITTPLSTQNVRLIATSSSFESQPSSFDSMENALYDTQRIAPIAGAVIGGVFLISLLVGLLITWIRRSRRRRDQDTLDMMAPSNLPDAYVRATQEHRRVSTAWYDPSEKGNG